MTSHSASARRRFARPATPLALALALALALLAVSGASAADGHGHGDSHAAHPAAKDHAAEGHEGPHVIGVHAHSEGDAPELAGHGAHGAHGEGHHGEEAHGEHGEHEHEHVQHAIPSIFDLLKEFNKPAAKTKEKFDKAHWELVKAEAELAAATAINPKGDLAKEAERDAAVAKNNKNVEKLREKRAQYAEAWEQVAPGAKAAIYLYENKRGVTALAVILLWTALAAMIKRNAAIRPGRWSSAGETLVEGLFGLFEPVLGTHETRRYFPFLATLFCFILFNNFMAIIPGFLSPSAYFECNIGLGLCVFAYVQYIGITRAGPKNYILHFMGEPPLPPKNAVEYFQWGLGTCLMLPLEILGELIRPISLSLRLFGNILGEDILLFVFLTIGMMIPVALFPWIPFGLPMHFLVYPLILLGCTIQALVFTLLSAVYISLKLPHGDHH